MIPMKCIQPSKAKADCEAKGYKYEIDTGLCIKKSLKAQPGQAEEQSPKKAKERSSQASEESEEEYKPKKKNKKRYRDSDND